MKLLEYLTPYSASEASYSRFEASFIVQGILYIRHIRGLSHLHPPDFSTYGVNCKVHRYICKVEGGALVFESGGRRDGWKWEVWAVTKNHPLLPMTNNSSLLGTYLHYYIVTVCARFTSYREYR